MIIIINELSTHTLNQFVSYPLYQNTSTTKLQLEIVIVVGYYKQS